ncbi:zinc finger Ran-binding domain-containing protein 2-like isoform X2 [Osmia bicornis bicornis]|uniref:zinc finger Ran-binding domain-containing protein 2-like isoform X2 n=1 Tax=Osmia bicornis bicornis TaxID=1437191 RepID=UPI0010F49D73|nr:zinc finger Ran-binding domain-containing protein 2-like isoform X2 [Osmia bicornis bicornis]XP_029041048.1 zinc finger Ran-binding domain-containing protein 2-like isoform X2 [Osmia bicornis bicornis]XP_029041049.1 zinc finger Ran-binding domain-containing protein 2-like isoform X2 [Osmia bicornis bicornis]XP_029041050.1 zinc finger Ran-binding domain-containing protein 2-like isoform X2 [Osmia bicornis bicornis]
MESSKVDEENQRNINDGDWICPDSQCANVNFARRNSCNRCGKDRGECPKKKKLGQEIGKAAAEKSRGLFSADDWQCSKCGNVNWARRQQCNMCNAPKFGEIEERTGYGGGYNDRGVVEYKERRDDDDEYDEFGRRRKKRRIENRSDDDSKDSRYSSPPRNKSKDEDERDEVQNEEEHNEKNNAKEEVEEVEEEEVEEEDEEEDDEEDGDLSKYDLSEWDDIAVKKNTNGSTASSEEQQSRDRDDWRDSGTSSQ